MEDVLDRQLGAVHVVEVRSREPEAWMCLGHDRAHDPPRPRLVRLLPPSLWSSDAAAARFLEAARLQSSFTHPNVARCLSWSRDADGAAWALIEWVDSERLNVFVERSQRAAGLGLALDRAFALILQMTEGVKSLHNVNRIHGRLGLHAFRRLKQLSDEDWVQLLDVGMCAGKDGQGGLSADGSAATLAAAYRPSWWSSERAPTAVVDVYALVVCLYCMVTGNAPQTFAGALEGLETTHPSLKRRCPELVSFFRRVGTDEALYGTPSSAPLLLHTLEELRGNVRPAARAQRSAASVLRGGGRAANRTNPGLARTTSGLARSGAGVASESSRVSASGRASEPDRVGAAAGRRSAQAQAQARRGMRSKGGAGALERSAGAQGRSDGEGVAPRGAVASAERSPLLDLQAPGKGSRDGVHERDLARLGHTIEEMGRALKRLLRADALAASSSQARDGAGAAVSNGAGGPAAERSARPEPSASPAPAQRPRAVSTPERAMPALPPPALPKTPDARSPAVSAEVPALPSMRANLGDASVLELPSSSAAGSGGFEAAPNPNAMTSTGWGDASLLGLSPNGDSLLPPPMLPPPPSLALAAREVPLPGWGVDSWSGDGLDELPDPASFDDDDDDDDGDNGDLTDPPSWPDDEVEGLSWDDALGAVGEARARPAGWLVVIMHAAGAAGRLKGLFGQLGLSGNVEPWALGERAACVAVEGATDNASVNALLGRLMMGGASQAVVVLERTQAPLAAQTLDAQLGEAMRVAGLAQQGQVVASPRLIDHAQMRRFFEPADAIARAARVTSAGWGRFET